MTTIEKIVNETLEMLNNKQYKLLREYLDEIDPVDIAEAMEALLDDEKVTYDQLPKMFRLLPKDLAADTFVEMNPDMQESLIKSLTDKELEVVLDDVFVDDAVDIIEEMPANVVTRVLKNVDADTRKSINQILKYPEDSAGSIMTTEYVSLRPTMSVGDAITHIRQTGVDKETIYVCYVTEKKRLLGLCSVRELLLAKDDTLVRDIMEDDIISVKTTDDKEYVAQVLARYDFTAVPVVDNDNLMVGIVTVDDAIDVLTEEATEDIQKMAAVTPSEQPYLRSSVFEIWKQRIPWLLFLMISATFTSIIITKFEDQLATVVALTAYIPMIMGTGGNSGSQSSVTIIRGLSLGEIDLSDVLSVIWKEFRVSILCGACVGATCFVKLMLIDRLLLRNPEITILVGLVVACTLVVTVMLAKVVGCTLPLLAKKLGFDPAVMASPFITTIVDALSLMIYMLFASLILNL